MTDEFERQVAEAIDERFWPAEPRGYGTPSLASVVAAAILAGLGVECLEPDCLTCRTIKNAALAALRGTP